MKQKPTAIVILAFFHFVAPIGNLFFNARINGISVLRYLEFFGQAQNLSRLLPNVLLPMAAGFCVYICRKWSFYLYILIMLLMTTLNYFRFRELQQANSTGILFVVVLFNILLVAYFMNPGLRMYYLDPAMRFWETKPRFKIEISAMAECPPSQLKVSLQNFSESGAFLVSPLELPRQGPIRIRFKYREEDYVFVGEIARFDEVTKGVGMRFVHNRPSKRRAAQLVQAFIGQGIDVHLRQKSTIDQFKRWIAVKKG